MSHRTKRFDVVVALGISIGFALLVGGCLDGGGQQQGDAVVYIDVGGGNDAGSGSIDDGPDGFRATRDDEPDRRRDAGVDTGSNSGTEYDSGGGAADAGGCGSGKRSCGGRCVDTSSNDNHCGKCGKSCPSGTTCKSGSCKCSNGGTLCGGSCVDTSSNDNHCGKCGNSCADGQSCKSGSCKCPSGEKLCGGSCTDVTSNTDHCGKCGNSCSGGEVCSSGSCGPSQEVANVISETNNVRSTQTDCGQYGTLSSAPPLQGNAKLHKAAQRHADDMANNGFFSHTGSDGSSFDERIRDAGFSGRPVAENIAAGNSTAASTVQQWKDSDGHCRNMMNSTATHIGVGFATGGMYGYYWVQVFGRK